MLRLVDWLSEVAGYTSAVLVLAAALIVCYGVLLRYFLGASTVWQTELSIYFLIYATFVGAAYGLRHGDHVRVDLVVRRFPPVAREVAKLAAAVLGIGLAAVVAVLTYELWWHAVTTGRRSGTAWNPPLMFPYAILPLGMTLVVLQYVVIAVDTVRRIATGPAGDDDDAPGKGAGG